MHKYLFVPVLAAFSMLGVSAQAAVTLKLDGYALTNSLGAITSIGSGAANSTSNAANSRTMQWQVDSIGATGVFDIAGQFGGVINEGSGNKSFSAFCVELTQSFNPFPTGTLTYDRFDAKSVYSTATYDKIGRLYSQNIVFDTAEKAAAFQIALWEIVYETTPTLAVGDAAASKLGTADFFSYTGATASAATFALAQNYLNALSTTAFNPKIGLVVYKNATSQDLIVAIPEPTTYALMLAGLVGIGALSVRRSREHI